jgi:outer membrane protein, heavy metal efflux system
MKRLFWGLVAAAIPIAAHATPMGYQAAIERALANAPALKAKALGVDATRAATRAADALPDPKLAMGLDNFPVSGPPAGSFTRDEMTMARIGVMQEVPSASKRRARLSRAQADIVAAEASARVTARDVRVGAALAWIDLAFATKRLTAIEGLLDRLRRLVGASSAGVASGAARPAEVLERQQALAMLEDRRSEIAAAGGRARAELVRWTGDPAAEAVGDLPTIMLDPAALRAGLDRHPTVRALAAAAGQSDADLALARAEKRPDWSWDVAYQRRAERYGDMVSAGVTVNLPLFAGRRQDPMIAARVAEAGKARAEQEAARRELVARLDAALADHVMHHEQWVRARDRLLPLAEQQLDLENASYAAGRAGLLDVVKAHIAAAEMRLTVLDREAVVSRDAALLTLTYGSNEQ